MKQFTILTILFVFIAFCAGAQSYSGGSGTAGDPYQIATKADLKYLSENSGEWSKHFKQISNVEFIVTDFQNGGDFYNGGEGFIPIGNNSIPFSGTYKGNLFKISNLYIDRTSTDYVGFFGKTSGSTLDSIMIVNSTVKGRWNVGGLAGYNLSTTINACSVDGYVFGTSRVGGFIGRIESSPVNRCSSSGNAICTTDYAGGFTGYNYNSTLSYCRSTCNVSGESYIGGLVGYHYYSYIWYAYASGKVSATGFNNGGLNGQTYSSYTNYSFWNTETSTQTLSADGTGKTTAQMQTQSTFTDTGWDFSTIWKMDLGCPNFSHPILIWEQSVTGSFPTVTSSSGDSRCGTGQVAISASPSAGTIKWYTSPYAGFAIEHGENYAISGNDLTIDNSSTTTTYYAEALDGGCKSSTRTSVAATVVPLPTVTATTPSSRCEAGTVTLSATPSNGIINWYDASTNGTLVGTGGTNWETPSISSTTTYYAEVVDGSCVSSARTAVEATVVPLPTITSTTPSSRCEAGTLTLSAVASGGSINWYDASTNGNLVGTGGTNWETPAISSTTTFYAEGVDGTCLSAARTPVLATVIATPTVTSTTPASRCGSGTLTLAASVSNGTIDWYDASTGGNYEGSGISWSTPSISSTTTYYAEANDGGCKSIARVSVSATVEPLPTIASTTPASRCGSGSITISSAPSAGAIQWFTVPTGGTALTTDGTYSVSGNDLTINNLSSTTIYYAEAVDGSCYSSSRTAVVATILAYCYSGGSGTSPDPFQIATKADLKYLSENTVEWTKHFVQTANITFSAGDFLNGGDFYNGGLGFIPIGNNSTIFSGTYNGQNYDIENLKIIRGNQIYVGLFGKVSSTCTLQNISLVNGDITGDQYVAGTVGYNGGGSVTNCSFSGNVRGMFMRVGGIVGESTSGSSVTNCHASVSLICDVGYGGGVVGLNYGSINDSYSSGSVGGDFRLGGLVGQNYTGATINNSFSTSSVSGNQYLGGFLGANNGTVNNCYSTGSVGVGTNTGGFIGLNDGGTINNCYSIGSVDAGTNDGGFAGTASVGSVNFSFYDNITSGKNDTGNGEPKSTTDMKNQATFEDAPANWDFSTIWEMGICTNDGYPVFQWQTLQLRPTISDPLSDTRCDAGTLDLGATASAGDVKWYAASTGGTSLGTGSTFTTPYLSSTTSYWAEADNGGCISASRTEVIATIENCSKLVPADCGRSLTLMEKVVSFVSVPGATDYEILVKGPGSYNQSIVKGNTNTTFRMSWFSGLSYNTTYTVEIRARVGGLWGIYGDVCNMTTPATQFEPKLNSESCGTTLTNWDEVLEYRTIYEATDYEIWVQGPNSYSSTKLRNSSATTFKMSWFSGLKLGVTYTVKIRAFVNGSWTSYGSACNVVAPPIPTTELIPGDCGITLGTYDEILEFTSVKGATDYEIWVQGPSSYSSTKLRNINRTNVRLSWFSGLQTNTTYTVKVRPYVDGIWGIYGNACNVTTAGTLSMQVNNNENTYKGAEEMVGMKDFTLETYPNPNDGNFTVRTSEECTLKIVNELGQEVLQINLGKENGFQTEVANLNKGVYFIITNPGREILAKKIVVQ